MDGCFCERKLGFNGMWKFFWKININERCFFFWLNRIYWRWFWKVFVEKIYINIRNLKIFIIWLNFKNIILFRVTFIFIAVAKKKYIIFSRAIFILKYKRAKNSNISKQSHSIRSRGKFLWSNANFSYVLERVVRSINSAYIDSCTMGEWWIGQDIPCLSTKLDVSKFRPIDIFLCWQRRKRLRKTFSRKRETWNVIESNRKAKKNGICIFDRVYIGNLYPIISRGIAR